MPASTPNQRILGFRPPPEPSGPVPSVINANLRPDPKSLEIFPAHVAGDASDRRHWLADIQRRVLYGMRAVHMFGRIANCMSRPIPAGGLRKDGTAYETGAPGKVQLHQYADDAYGFAWVQHCGNPLLCFTCAPKVRHKRRQEVRAATAWALNQCLAPIMITFTAPHYADTDPRRQVDAFQAAKRRFKSGRWWQEQKAKIGYKHSIRALEVTMTHPQYGLGNGAHVHDHGIYYCDHLIFTSKDVDGLLADWLPRWRDCLLAEGVEIRDMDAFWRYGLDFSLPRVRQVTKRNKDGEDEIILIVDDAEAGKMADYVADDMAATISPALWAMKKRDGNEKTEIINKDDVADQISWEISPGIFGKKGRGNSEKDKHINHFEYFALALTKYKECRPYMLKLMVALKGRSWLQWTRGLKQAVGIEEKDDADLMREDGGGVIREYDTQKEWYPINNRKLQRRYIRAMVDDGGEAAETADRMMRIIKAGFDPLTGEAFDDASG